MQMISSASRIGSRSLKAGVAAIAMVSGSQALAQSAPANPVATPADVSATSNTEIMVTARKRSERLQDVPASITAYTGDQLEAKDIRNIQGTLGITPGLYVTGSGLSPSRDFRQLVIRGVGGNSALEPSVATFIDGVYAPALDFDTDFLDVERVEVLKGPQGALFGRNTEAGAINIITRKPNNDTHVRMNFLADEFHTAQASASVSGPIVKDKLFGSISALYKYSDYFVKVNGKDVIPDDPFFPGVNLAEKWNAKYTDLSPADGQRQETARATLRYLPSDTTEINLNAHVSHFKGVDQAPGPLTSCHCYVVDGDLAYAQESMTYGASLQAEKRTDPVKINLILGYEYARSSDPYDFDGTADRVGNYHDFDRKQKSMSAELRFSSNESGPFQWIGGLYAFREKQFNDRFYIFSNMDAVGGPQSSFDGLWNQQLTDLTRTGVAGFGQATYEITSKLEVALGARYSWEHVKASALERFEFAPNGVITSYTPSTVYGWPDFYTPTTDSTNFHNFSPQGSIRYKIARNLTAYVSIARGFKAGGYQTAPVSPSDVAPIKPETTTNYEAGFKGELFGGKVNFDAAGYHIDITNQQLQSGVIRGDIAVSQITNASKSKIDGFELSLGVHPTRRLTLNGNVAYTDARFAKYEVLPGDINGDGVTNSEDLVNRSGQRLPATPKWTYNIGGTYSLPIAADTLTFDVNFRHVGSIVIGSGTTASDPFIGVPSWNRLDIGLTLEHGPVSVRLFADNVTNNYIILSKFLSFQVQPTTAYIHNLVDAPRRIGGSIGYKF